MVPFWVMIANKMNGMLTLLAPKLIKQFPKNKNLKITQIHGKQLSYNNYNDIFSALTISKNLPKRSSQPKPTCEKQSCDL